MVVFLLETLLLYLEALAEGLLIVKDCKPRLKNATGLNEQLQLMFTKQLLVITNIYLIFDICVLCKRFA